MRREITRVMAGVKQAGKPDYIIVTYQQHHQSTITQVTRTLNYASYKDFEEASEKACGGTVDLIPAQLRNMAPSLATLDS